MRTVPPGVFEDHADTLPAPLRLRAAHFFGEQERVRAGVELWKAGDLEGFGRLVSESGRSSIEHYECGNAHLRAAYEALRGCPGVYGARFSGAGFRGCCIALADPAAGSKAAETALARYLGRHPDMKGLARAYCCKSGGAAAILE